MMFWWISVLGKCKGIDGLTLVGIVQGIIFCHTVGIPVIYINSGNWSSILRKFFKRMRSLNHLMVDPLSKALNPNFR